MLPLPLNHAEVVEAAQAAAGWEAELAVVVLVVAEARAGNGRRLVFRLLHLQVLCHTRGRARARARRLGVIRAARPLALEAPAEAPSKASLEMSHG